MPNEAMTDAGAVVEQAGLMPTPANRDERLAAARSAEDRGDLLEALQLLAALRADFPDHPAAYHQAGLAMLRLADEAAVLLEDARARFPGDIGIAVTLARVADRQGDHRQSIARWEYVKAHFPTYAVGYFNLGLSLRRAGRLDDADPALRAAAERFPDYADAAIEYARLADIRRDGPEAATRWEQVRSRFPDHPAGYLEAASSARAAADPDAEDRIFDLVLERFPGNFDIILEFLRHASGSGDWPRVLRRWEKARALFPDRPLCYTNVGHALRMLQRLDDADLVLGEGVRRCPADGSLLAAYAWMAFYRRDWAEALQRWQAVRMNNPDLLDGFIGMAATLRERQQFDEAEDLLNEAQQRFPDDPHPLTERVWLSLHRRDWTETVRRGADARARLPWHVAGYTASAIALREMERFDEADALLEDGIQRLPDWRPFVDEYAEVARRRGDLPQMLARLKAGQGRFPADAGLQQRIAETEARLGARKDEAAIAAAVPAGNETQRKYLLHSSNLVGIGHTCMAILQCAIYAYRTNRVLVLDMRQSLYFSSRRHEAFFENFGFEFPPELEVITDLAEAERIGGIRDSVDLSPSNRLDPAIAISETVLRVQATSPGANNMTLGDKPLDQRFRVVLRGPLGDAWNAVMAAPQWSGPVIGLHFRALMGEITLHMNPVIVPDYEARCDTLWERYVETARAIANEAGFENPAYFIASEDLKFNEYIKSRLPNAFSLATRLPNIPGQSFVRYIQDHGYDLSILIDAVNDAWCLSECEYLVCTDHSRFTKFTVLNSKKLDQKRIRTVPVPLFSEILETLEPETAAQWANDAVWKHDDIRVRAGYFHEIAAAACDRAGRPEEAAAARRRARWDGEMAALHLVPKNLEMARKRTEVFTDNPYVLAGYHDSLADMLARNGLLEEAVAVARRAIELNAIDPHLHAQLARVLRQSNLLEEAEAAARRAVELEPEGFRLCVEWSDCLARLQRWDAAAEAMRSAVALDPAAVGWRARLGELLLTAGRYVECEQVLRDAIALFANHHRLDHVLSIALDRQNRVPEAVLAARRVQELDPANPGWPVYVGGLLQRMGQFDEAEQAYRQALELDPGSDAARAALAAIAAARPAKTLADNLIATDG